MPLAAQLAIVDIASYYIIANKVFFTDIDQETNLAIRRSLDSTEPDKVFVWYSIKYLATYIYVVIALSLSLNYSICFSN